MIQQSQNLDVSIFKCSQMIQYRLELCMQILNNLALEPNFANVAVVYQMLLEQEKMGPWRPSKE